MQQEVVQHQFDKDYQHVRKRLLQGAYTLDIAKMWLQKHGALAAKAMLIEREAVVYSIMSRRADRELDLLHKYEKSEEHGDNDE